MTSSYTGSIFVMFLSTVMELVCAEIAALSKFQVTKNAFSRLFPSVYFIVDSEMRVSLHCVEHVVFHGYSKDEIFFTEFTNPSPKNGFSPVWQRIQFLRAPSNVIYQ